MKKKKKKESHSKSGLWPRTVPKYIHMHLLTCWWCYMQAVILVYLILVRRNIARTWFYYELLVQHSNNWTEIFYWNYYFSKFQPTLHSERGRCRVQTNLSFDVEITIPFSLTKFSIDNEVLPIPLTSHPIRKFSFYFFNKQVVNFTFHLIKNHNEIPHLFN